MYVALFSLLIKDTALMKVYMLDRSDHPRHGKLIRFQRCKFPICSVTLLKLFGIWLQRLNLLAGSGLPYWLTSLLMRLLLRFAEFPEDRLSNMFVLQPPLFFTGFWLSKRKKLPFEWTSEFSCIYGQAESLPLVDIFATAFCRLIHRVDENGIK